MLKDFCCKNNLLLVGYILITTFLLYYRDVVGVMISKYIFVAITVIFSLVVNYQTLLSLMAFSLPLLCGLPGNFFLPVWVVLILYHLSKLRRFDYRGALLFAGFVILFEFFHYLFYSYSVGIMDFVGYSCALILLSVLSNNASDLDYSKPVLFFCIGSCVLLIIAYLVYMQNNALLFDRGVRMGGDAYREDGVMSLSSNANAIGLFSSSCIACAITLYYYQRIKIIPLFAIVLPAFYCGMFSVSRTWVLSLVLVLLFFFVFNKEHKKYGYILLGLLLVVIGYFVKSNPDFLNMFVDRFTDDTIETGGGRTTLFGKYNDFLIEHWGNLLFGTGALIYKEVTGIFVGTHNGLQQILVSYGVVGFVIFMIAFWKVLCRNYTKGHYMALLPMVAVVFFLQTIQVLNPHYGLYTLLIAFWVMKMVQIDTKGLQKSL